ncbi:MAG: sugar phosphate isomerase/epimerase [Deltaproteobacteria bacterium]|nr:sugar phosphate isomerase/epimerase [Deltaproteobacteria bacterium]MBW2445835.1 sugar phosphate isomerase/epimerase [Deltaproteobacteria bacterium]
MPLGPDDLVLCAGTLLEADFTTLCDAAQAGGFSGITLWPDHVERARAAGHRDDDLRAHLADAGLVVADLDPLLTWLPDEPTPDGFADEATFFALADAFDARSLNAAQGFGTHVDRDRAAEAFAGVCDRAAEHGLLITLEYLPWSGIPDAATALDIVERAGRDNGTVMVDVWHTFRGATDEAQLRALPGNRIGSVQLNDAPAEPGPELLAETMNARRLPGEGDAPVVEWVRILDDCGLRAPVGVEVFSEALRALPPEEIGRRCGDAARNVLALARA